MPSWEMHIVVANKVNEKLKLDNGTFIFGNVMTDAEGFVIENPSIIVKYDISHFAKREQEGIKEKLPNYKGFAEKYNKFTDNPVVVGYLVHLMTDYFWNRFTFKNYYIHNEQRDAIGIKLNNNQDLFCDITRMRELKQKDFRKFSNNLLDNNKVIVPKFDIDKIAEKIKDIKEIPLNREDIEKYIKFLNSINKRNKFVEKYNVFTEEIFNTKIDECVEFIFQELRKSNVT